MSSDKGDGFGGWPPTPEEMAEGLVRREAMFEQVAHIATNKEARGQFNVNAKFYNGVPMNAGKKESETYKPEVCHNPKLEQMRRNMRRRHEQSAARTTTTTVNIGTYLYSPPESDDCDRM
jgi:hypothetical protein